MHVAVDAVGIKQGGGIIVLNGIVDALCHDERVERITIFCSPYEKFDGDRAEGNGVIWREMTWEDRSYAARLAWLQRGLAHVTDRLNATTLLCLNGVGSSRVPRVNYVQQSLYFSEEGLALLTPKQRSKYRLLAQLARLSCRSASKVVVQSEWMRREIKRAWSIDCTVAPPVPPAVMLPTDRTKQVLWVGSDLGYKRRDDFDDAIKLLKGDGFDFRFAESGEKSWPRLRMRDVMRGATALVMTSMVESFCLPIAEAMAWSCPVIACDAPYARDLCDNAAVYFEPGAAEQIAVWIRELGSSQSDLRESLISRGHNRVESLRGLDGYRVVVDAVCEASQ